jgi:outer membrane receptor protein involved in Fe transport
MAFLMYFARMRTAALVIVCLFLFTSPALAATISGTVVDASGAPVAGASVIITSSGQEHRVTTNDNGTFEAANVPDGEVQVRASAPGFAESLQTLKGDAAARLVLQPAPLVDVVTVTASRGVERLGTAASATVLTSAELLNSAAGALDDALRNTPGFSLFRRSSSRVSNPTTQGVTLRGVSGSGASRTMVLADGLPLNDAFGSWVYWNKVPQAAIERVEIVRGATGDLYGADALGGVVQVLTFSPGRTRLRASVEGGSHDTGRFSGFGSVQRNGWHVQGAGEWQKTDGVFVIAPEVRGPVDTRADSDYGTGFVDGGYDAGQWHTSVRVSHYKEDRGNGTPLQVNDTEWTQVGGDAGGAAFGGAWQARAAGGTQSYFQTFTAVAANRATERLTTEQTTPSSFANVSGQWTRTWQGYSLLVGGEGRHTDSEVEEFRYSLTNVRTGPFFAGGTETTGSGFARVSFAPAERLTLVAGVRVDGWQSTPDDAALPEHSAVFLSPRVSAAYRVDDRISLHGAIYRASRTPTLNELHRGFRVGNVVTNPNPLLDPEQLGGAEGGVLFTSNRLSARVTAFWNRLTDAITNVTIAQTAAQITRERQNTDSLRAAGIEVEADVRPHRYWTIGGLLALTGSTFTNTPAQPALDGNRVPQVPTYQVGANVTYLNPRYLTAALQLRVVGDQYDDDLNEFVLEGFTVVDMSASRELRRGIHAFVAVENLFDAEYDVGRTPIRSIGWPRTFRGGVRFFLP